MTSESPELIVLKSINNKLQEIIDIFQIKAVVNKTLADFSESNRPRSATDKPMPEMLGEYTVAKKGGTRCGGKITWENYEKETQPYPDHLSVHGDLIACPEYKPE